MIFDYVFNDPAETSPCASCYRLDWRTMIAHLMMCNYRDGIASQSVVEVIEDTFATLHPMDTEAVIAAACYDGDGGALHDIASDLRVPLPLLYAWRLQWLRRLAAALDDAELLVLTRPVIDHDAYAALMDSIDDPIDLVPPVSNGIDLVLVRLGKRRRATPYEAELYRKWVDDWGLKVSDILDSCATLKGFPTFTNLDSALARRRANFNPPQAGVPRC